jgi:hypothetical protein
MHKLTAFVLTTLLLAACAAREGPPSLTSPFHLITTVAGLSLVPPPEPGWIIAIQEANQVVLVRRAVQSGETYGAAASVYPLPEIASNDAFLTHISAARATAYQTSRVTLVKNDESLAEGRPARCVRYHTISEDKADRVPSARQTLLLQSIGYHCQHPKNRQVGVNLKYSHRYAPGHEDSDLAAKANEFLHKAGFTDF